MNISGKINNSGYINVPSPRWHLPRAFRVELNLLPPTGHFPLLSFKLGDFCHTHPRLVIINEGKAVETLHAFLDRKPFGSFDDLRQEVGHAPAVQLAKVGDYSSLCPKHFFTESIAGADAGSIYADAYHSGNKKKAEFSYDRVSWVRVLFSWLGTKFSRLFSS